MIQIFHFVHGTMMAAVGDAMKPFVFFLLLINSGLVLADPNTDPQLVRLETTINKLQQEQQSVYQQFQMTEELRQIEIEEINSIVTQNPATMTSVDPHLLNYDENIRLQRERQERIQLYTRDLGRLNSRYSELADQKKALLDQMIELAQQPKP
jgi:hypothetical protein